MTKELLKPGAILYDEYRNSLVIWTGHIVEDDIGQDAFFCHNTTDEETTKGVIYTCWLVRDGHLTVVGNVF